VKLPDVWSRATPVFDDENLVSCAGLVPLMVLAERAGLSELIGQRVRFKTSRVASAGQTRPGSCARSSRGWPPVRTVSMIWEWSVRVGCDKQFGGVYAPATLGSVLRAFTYGTQMVMALLPHVNRSGRVPSLPHEEGP